MKIWLKFLIAFFVFALVALVSLAVNWKFVKQSVVPGRQRTLALPDYNKDPAAFIRACEKLGGKFNSCGSACGPGAEVCIEMCVPQCELKK